MPQYIILIMCIYILAATGMLRDPCRTVGIKGFELCYVLLCTLALSIFQLKIGMEASINLGAVVLAFMPGSMMRRGEGTAGIGTVMLMSIVIALLRGSEKMYGADSGLLSGFMAGATAFILADSPASAAFAAGGIPVVAAVMEAFISLAFSGYVSIEIGHDAIVAQLIALVMSGVILWIRSLMAERADAE